MLSVSCVKSNQKNIMTSWVKSLNQVRYKRTKSKGSSSITPQTQRIITQLSVLSARKKQPKMLKLSKEDLIKHQTIQTAWNTYQDILQNERQTMLKLQYNKMDEAMTILKDISPKLYNQANIDESGKVFPMEMRVPTDYPPRKLWYYDYKK
ncbi:similar to Saccharomyces cerevisiae YDR462W MRPL28 Mitochondrial ribosomal protein of the large subunit [Maudiozyma saulgeensis]|uniref:Large ribosomal subunit protein mL40 n=1 Tax=Maudiozyma saulgeensis TaxID=1789683 RepID=A0A1X7R5W4_9SACH|nr:similar to Saccharomyces cerevisiae YDR462W MRPL28 Mitochondrial ribosomal protein of the large subunit [Kazachstania saulgeensis]